MNETFRNINLPTTLLLLKVYFLLSAPIKLDRYRSLSKAKKSFIFAMQ